MIENKDFDDDEDDEDLDEDDESDEEKLSKDRPTTCPKCGHGLIEKWGASGVKCPKCKWFKLD